MRLFVNNYISYSFQSPQRSSEIKTKYDNRHSRLLLSNIKFLSTIYSKGITGLRYIELIRSDLLCVKIIVEADPLDKDAGTHMKTESY